MAGFSEIATVIRERLTEFRNHFQQTIAPALHNVFAKCQEAFNSESFKLAVSIIKELIEVVYRYGTLHEKFCVLAITLGWLPHPIVFPTGVIEVMNEYEANGEDAARAKLDSFYVEVCTNEKLTEMMQEWEQKPLLQRRMPILKQALDAHIEGKYFIALPIFLTQMEGILVDGYVHRGELYSQKRRDLLEKALSNRQWLSFDEAILNIIAFKVFNSFKHGEVPSFEINRNAILHGASTEYGTHINSLKCILLFDYLQAKVGFVTFTSSKRYHLVTCSVVSRHMIRTPQAKIEPYTYMNEYKAACKICRPDMPVY